MLHVLTINVLHGIMIYEYSFYLLGDAILIMNRCLLLFNKIFELICPKPNSMYLSYNYGFAYVPNGGL